jgi:hypothetical protein
VDRILSHKVRVVMNTVVSSSETSTSRDIPVHLIALSSVVFWGLECSNIESIIRGRPVVQKRFTYIADHILPTRCRHGPSIYWSNRKSCARVASSDVTLHPGFCQCAGNFASAIMGACTDMGASVEDCHHVPCNNSMAVFNFVCPRSCQ